MIREGRGSLFGREKEGYMGGITRMKGKGEAMQLYYNLKNKRCLQTEAEGMLKMSQCLHESVENFFQLHFFLRKKK